MVWESEHVNAFCNVKIDMGGIVYIHPPATGAGVAIPTMNHIHYNQSRSVDGGVSGGHVDSNCRGDGYIFFYIISNGKI
jgi:hypothetical protein